MARIPDGLLEHRRAPLHSSLSITARTAATTNQSARPIVTPVRHASEKDTDGIRLCRKRTCSLKLTFCKLFTRTLIRLRYFCFPCFLKRFLISSYHTLHLTFHHTFSPFFFLQPTKQHTRNSTRHQRRRPLTKVRELGLDTRRA